MNRRDAIKGVVAVGAGLLVGNTTDANQVQPRLISKYKTINSTKENRLIFTDPTTMKEFAVEGLVDIEERFYLKDGKYNVWTPCIAENQTIEGFFIDSPRCKDDIFYSTLIIKKLDVVLLVRYETKKV